MFTFTSHLSQHVAWCTVALPSVIWCQSSKEPDVIVGEGEVRLGMQDVGLMMVYSGVYVCVCPHLPAQPMSVT